MTDYGAEFDRIHLQAKRDGKTMSLANRIVAIVIGAICFTNCALIAMADLRVFPGDFQALVAFVAFCFFCVGGFLFYVAATVPAPPKIEA